METTVNTPQTKTEGTKKKFYQKKWGKILIGVVVVIAVLIAIALQATSAAVKVSNQFLNALQSQDSKTAYSLFANEVKNEVEEDEFKTVVDQVGPILNTKEKLVNRAVSAETGKESTAQVVYEVVGTDDKKYVVAIDLIKEDGEWRVQTFDSDEADN